MATSNIFQKFLCKIYENFHKDTAKMLIWTTLTGYVLSSFAQIFGIAFSSKFSNEQKSFLLPQECGDALANIATFLAITTVTKKTVAKLFSTGKWATKGVKAFLKSKPELATQIGKLDFDVANHLTNESLIKDYNSCKAIGTTVATIGAGIVSSSIITPLIRNKMAAKSQKAYLEFAKEPMKYDSSQKEKDVTFKATSHLVMNNYSSGLRI